MSISKVKVNELNTAVIQAFINDEEIQWQHNGEWQDGVHQFINPISSPETKWRVKPKGTQPADMSVLISDNIVCRFWDEDKSEAELGFLLAVEPNLGDYKYKTISNLGFEHVTPDFGRLIHLKIEGDDLTDRLNEAGFQYQYYTSGIIKIVGLGEGFCYPWELE